MPTPPGHSGLAARLAGMQRQIDELSRRRDAAAVCMVRLAEPVRVPAATHTPIVTNWRPDADADQPGGMWHYDDNGASYVRLPHAGRYVVWLHLQWSPGVAAYDADMRFIPGAVAGYILRNGTEPEANAIGTTSATFNAHVPGAAAPGDGTTLDVHADDLFRSGDRLHFGVWSRYPATVRESTHRVWTRVVVRYIGPE